jgi:hypothetical protein
MSVIRPLKPYLTAIEQIALLKKRGLAIPDDAVGLQALARFGYYRLSGYYYPLRKTNPVGVPGRQDEFIDNSSLDLVVRVADFDKRLRLLALSRNGSLDSKPHAAIRKKNSPSTTKTIALPCLFGLQSSSGILECFRASTRACSAEIETHLQKCLPR